MSLNTLSYVSLCLPPLLMGHNFSPFVVVVQMVSNPG